MKTNARYAYALTLALAPLAGCGDDGGSTNDTMATGSTSEAATSDPGTTSSTGTDAPETTGGEVEASSSGAADESSSGGTDPFADCSREVLESDLVVVNAVGVPGAPQWYGPGADADGALIDDGETEYVVSVTYLALKPDADFDHFNQLNVANSMALYANPGMVGLQLGFSMECATARTFTVWESEAAMMEFVGSEAHLQSVSAFPSFSRGGSTLSVWPETATASEITWEAALEQMAEATAYD